MSGLPGTQKRPSPVRAQPARWGSHAIGAIYNCAVVDGNHLHHVRSRRHAPWESGLTVLGRGYERREEALRVDRVRAHLSRHSRANTHSFRESALLAHRRAVLPHPALCLRSRVLLQEIRHDLTRAHPRLLWLESLLEDWGYGAELAEKGIHFGSSGTQKRRHPVRWRNPRARGAGCQAARHRSRSPTAMPLRRAPSSVSGISSTSWSRPQPKPGRLAAKPAPAIFELALRQAQARPPPGAWFTFCLRRRPAARRRGRRARGGNAHGLDEPGGRLPWSDAVSDRTPRFAFTAPSTQQDLEASVVTST